mmetsp:Transcript_15834/g.40262  ORF Transcript_15834/g.40262 Transcript_15834/m.40262 type:complete len:202 (-) Transcript_15834:147-752(-)
MASVVASNHWQREVDAKCEEDHNCWIPDPKSGMGSNSTCDRCVEVPGIGCSSCSLPFVASAPLASGLALAAPVEVAAARARGLSGVRRSSADAFHGGSIMGDAARAARAAFTLAVSGAMALLAARFVQLLPVAVLALGALAVGKAGPSSQANTRGPFPAGVDDASSLAELVYGVSLSVEEPLAATDGQPRDEALALAQPLV